MTALTPLELYERLRTGPSPRILDVRNAEDFGRWKVEGPSRIPMLNIPYFEFIEAEDSSINRTTAWLRDGGGELVVVCAKGDSSEFVAGILRSRSIEARNLEGGMVAWGRGTHFQQVAAASGLRIWQAIRFGKGCLSYVLAQGRDAIVVDPHRDLGEFRSFLRKENLDLRAVFDTHLHADHISGGPALASESGKPYYAHSADFIESPRPFEPVDESRKIILGKVEVVPFHFLHAPGHTPGSTALVAGSTAVLTGDTLFVSSVGRPDLGGQAEVWGKDLHRTLTRRLAPLSDNLLVLPAHTSGPEETSGDGAVSATLGSLRRTNPALALDQESFLREMRGRLGSAPPEYATIRKINLGVAEAPEDQMTEMELGKNQCALSRR